MTPMTDPQANDPIDPTSAASPVDVQDETTTPVEADGATREQQLAAEVEAAREKHLRLAAEFDNFRRRAVKERQEAGWRAQGDLVRGLLDALDDLTRFANVDPSTMDSKMVIDGIALVEKKIFKSLAGHGFEVLDPTGHPFNPGLHEAVEHRARRVRRGRRCRRGVLPGGLRDQRPRPAAGARRREAVDRRLSAR